MKKILILLSASLLASGSLNIYFYIQMTRIENAASKVRVNDYFDKKRECEKMAQQIKADITKSNESDFSALVGTNLFETIFYSPKENSCLYSTQNIRNESDGSREFFIFNALTQSKITSFQFPSQFEQYKKFLLEYSNGEIRL